MYATETAGSDDRGRPPADEAEGTMERSHASFCGDQTPATALVGWPRLTLAAYPLRQ
jgi:hypothetical protein